MYDVLIIGCGIVGAAAAYRLSRYKLSVCVCERYNDVANGCTKANTAILHAGFGSPAGSLEARLNLRGIELAADICEKLSVERVPMPTFVIAYNTPYELVYIKKLYAQGVANGVKGLRIIEHDEALLMEPGLNPNVKAALYAPGSAIVNPWEYCIAMAETAVKNGVEIKLESKVTAIEKSDGYFTVTTSSGVFEARYVVNAGGAFSAEIYALVGGKGVIQKNFAGQYYVLDKSQGEKIRSIIFPCPDERGTKGICVTPTVHGNLLVGPDFYEVEDGDHVGTDPTTLKNLKEAGHRSVPAIDFCEAIHEYAGVRPNTNHPDFIIGEAPDCPHFINLAGIKSPGLSSAPAIAEELEQILMKCGLELDKKDRFTDRRKRIVFRSLSDEGKQEVIQKDPLYGRVICRCETVTEGEIVEAIHRPIIPRSIDAVKRRCNAGMGRCQGGFCGPRVHKILARELGVREEDILMDEQGTFLLTSGLKQEEADENII